MLKKEVEEIGQQGKCLVSENRGLLQLIEILKDPKWRMRTYNGLNGLTVLICWVDKMDFVNSVIQNKLAKRILKYFH